MPFRLLTCAHVSKAETWWSAHISSLTHTAQPKLLPSCAYAVWLLTFAIQQWQSRAVRAHLICFLSHNISPPVTLYSSMATCLPRKDNSLMAQPKAAESFAFNFQWTVWNSSRVTSCMIDLVQAEMDITISQTAIKNMTLTAWWWGSRRLTVSCVKSYID